MFRTGKECEDAGVYRSNDCGYEITLLERDPFPECPLHDRSVTWTFIRKTEVPKARPKRRQTQSE